MLMPPVRTLGFNAELTHSDGLLIESVSRRESISFEAAGKMVEKSVSSFLYQLKESGILPFGNLGTISTTDGSESLLFEPDMDNSIVNLPSCGLIPVALRALDDEKEVVDEAHVTHVRHRRLRRGRVAMLAASVAVLMVLFGFLIRKPDFPGAERHEYASIDSSLRSNVGKVVAVEEESILEISREILLNISRPVEPLQTKAASSTPVGRYILVIGSFPSQKAADRFINGDPKLSVMEMDGKYRVYAASASNINEARDKSMELIGTYPNVWICRR